MCEKNVLVLANNAGGLFRFRGMLLRDLQKKGYTVYASVPYDDCFADLEAMGVHLVETSIDRRGINPFKDVRLLFSYSKMIKNLKPIFVISYTIKPNVYGGMICRVLSVPYVLNITGLGSVFERGGCIERIVSIMNKIAFKKASVVFFENEGNRQFFIKKKIVKESKTHRLNGAGVDLKTFPFAEEYPTGTRVTFLFIGRVMKEKGIEELLMATQRLVNEGVMCELNVVGSYEEDYKEIISQHEAEGWLHYYGVQKDVRPYINGAHCFVLPSWHEGMANTNLESAASGRPVITTRIHGCMESVIEGVSGFLVEPKNVEDLYKGMKKFCNLSFKERKDMGLSGRKHMEDVFDKEKVVEETIDVMMKKIGIS